MKAAVRTNYGDSRVLQVRDMPDPVPGEKDLLVRVYAATVNRTDCHVLTGKPLFMRLFTGLLNPKLSTTGTDFAGQVIKVGSEVKSFKPGDKVIGFNFLGASSHASCLTIEERHVCRIPDGIRYEDAVACVEGGFYALSGIRKLNPVRGQNALVIGATGAIGSAHVQFLKYYGTTVTAVCQGLHKDLVLSLGAERVIDYTAEDLQQEQERFDLVFDAVGKYSFFKCKHLLKPGGRYTSSGGGQNLILPFLNPFLGNKKVVFAPPKDQQDCLDFIMDLLVKRQFRPVIDRSYPLEAIGSAFDFVATGEKIGSVVLSMPGQA